MSRTQAYQLKSRIEHETGNGPATVMLDKRGRYPVWVVGYAGRWYRSAQDWNDRGA